MRKPHIIRCLVVTILTLGSPAVQASDPSSTSYQINLAWNSNPEADIAGYRLYYGTQTGEHPSSVDVGNATVHDLILPDEGPYFAVVTAYNTAGLESSPSAELPFSPIANAHPSVAFISPVPGSTPTLEAPAEIPISVDASDSDGEIAKVEFFADGVLIGEAADGQPYSINWTGTQPGDYQLTARAYDDAGAFTDTPPVTVAVTDLTPPVIQNTPEGIVVPPDAKQQTAVVTWPELIVTDNVEVIESYYLRNWPGSEFPAGTTEVTFSAMDAAGNESNVSFTVSVMSAELWRQENFPGSADDPAVAGDLANLDGDTWNNLAEYALGLDPSASDGQDAFTMTPRDGAIELKATYSPLIPDIELKFEMSPSLPGEWQTLAAWTHSQGWDVVAAGTVLTTATVGSLDEVYLTTPDTAARGFYRLVITRLDPIP